jgi:ubiquinone/menaquinone biosynthesis C-methylase UbiE
VEKIRKEFDHIATLSEHQSDLGGAYDQFILSFVPNPCDQALEIGCGTGPFTRLLATKAHQVTALDLSGEMIRLARQRSTNHSNIEYMVADLLQMELPANRFDCIVMIATLHHLPHGSVFEKIKQALAPGGTLIIHDILASSGVFDRAVDLLRLPINVFVRARRTGRLMASRQMRQAWADHGKGERYLTMQGVKDMSDQYLAGAYVKRHLLWRYTVVWRRRDAA